MIGWVVKIF